MTDLHLVRHGPTHARTMVGWSDLPADLSDAAQIARLAAALPADALVVSSDLIRAAATADAIQGPRRRLPHAAALREFHFGDWELKSYAEIEAEDPERARAYWERPGEVRAPGGESWNEGAARMGAAIDALIAAHAGRALIVVAHFGLILTQLQRALGATPEEILAHRIDNLSVTSLSLRGSGWSATRINHLP